MSWICKRCETENPDRLKICEVCSSPREDSPIHKFKEDNTSQLNTYREFIDKQSEELATLQEESIKLKSQISSLKNKLRRKKWMNIILALILGGIVWTQVLFPSEVTRKNMGDFVYYGPIQDGKPHGEGIAIFHSNDNDGRLLYIGNFTDGKRIDDNAILFYNDSSYYCGSINEGELINGLFFDIGGAHFKGKFKNNEMWSGVKYKHVKEKTIVNGK